MNPKMLIMRNSPGGMIWHAYRVETEVEETILRRNATSHGFLVETALADYTEETSPGWRDTPEWAHCLKAAEEAQK